MDKDQLLETLRKQKISQKTLNAFEKVPREKFIPQMMQFLAYEDNALPIGHNQTISQPYTIAVMLDMLDIKKDQKVLEIGSGSGYALALISELVGENGKVYGLEIVNDLMEKSKKPLSPYKNVRVFYGDGRFGIFEKAPFDRIIISAALQEIPRELVTQLNDGGIIVAPVGPSNMQSIVAYKKVNKELTVIDHVDGFVFVPFT